MLTEDEARKKECCRDRSEYRSASVCMAWRWQILPAYMTGGTEYGLSDVHGFCGLAGEP